MNYWTKLALWTLLGALLVAALGYTAAVSPDNLIDTNPRMVAGLISQVIVSWIAWVVVGFVAVKRKDK